MLRELQPALIIAQREVRDQFRDWRIIIPILVLTLIFPSIMNFTARQALNFVERYGAEIVGERLIPFLLMVVGFFPISISLVIALESFVGEKERRSIEPLLVSPLSNKHLYLGKLLAVLVPPLLASYLGISVYLIGVIRQLNWEPEPILITQIILLTFVQALVMVSGAVVISSQTTSVRAANLLASFIIIPMAFLIQGESLVMFWGRYQILWWVIIGLIILSGLLLRTGISHFNREELIGRELDTLNIRWGLRTLLKSFKGNANSLREWYKQEVFPTVRKMIFPILLMSLLMVAAFWIGIEQAKIFVLPPDALSLENLEIGSFEGIESFSLLSSRGILMVWFHNVRVMIVALLLGLFTFGVLGLLVLMLPLILVGYFMTSLTGTGLSPLVFLTSFILPHGIFEIPAILMMGGSILYMGGRLAAPSKGKTVGEAWLDSLADWGKITIGIVFPLLFFAAIIEVMITPKVALLLLS